MRRMLLIAALMVGCLPSSDEVEETGSVDQPPEVEFDGCDELEIRYTGPDEPVVGDSWSVLLYCDGALLTGPLVLRFNPPEFATIDENTVTFVQVGTAEMRVQVGAMRETMDVTVTE